MIVRLYETFEDEKNIYLVQEYYLIDSASAKVENCSSDSSATVTSTRRMQGNSSRRW